MTEWPDKISQGLTRARQGVNEQVARGRMLRAWPRHLASEYRAEARGSDRREYLSWLADHD